MKILVICISSLERCPRAYRLVQALKNDHDVHVATASPTCIKDVSMHTIHTSLGRHKVEKFILLARGYYQRYVELSFSLGSIDALPSFDRIYLFDLLLIPLISPHISHQKLTLDLREYYPRQFEHDLVWRSTFGRAYSQICKDYLDETIKLTTVSKGLVNAYQKNFSLSPKLIYSCPNQISIGPKPVTNPIQLVHHGVSNANRSLENMIHAMDIVKEKAVLNLHIVNNNSGLYDRLALLSSQRNNVLLHRPLNIEELPEYLNRYDIGLFCPKPSTFNLTHSMPNKLFEYIQARLCIIANSRTEAGEFVKEHQVGVASTSHKPNDVADAILSLSQQQIERYKNNSNLKAQKLIFSALDWTF